jgi:hypothetical protein
MEVSASSQMVNWSCFFEKINSNWGVGGQTVCWEGFSKHIRSAGSYRASRRADLGGGSGGDVP